jgi:hypothetical protein
MKIAAHWRLPLEYRRMQSGTPKSKQTGSDPVAVPVSLHRAQVSLQLRLVLIGQEGQQV